MSRDELTELLTQILEEFDTSGPWTTLDVIIDGEVHTAMLDIGLSELIETAKEMVYDDN